MSKPSKTDFALLDKMADAEIDASDMAKLDAGFFKKAELRMPTKKPTTLQAGEDVLE